MQDAWQGKIIYYALGDAKINVGSNTLWHALTVVAICKIQDWSKLNWLYNKWYILMNR